MATTTRPKFEILNQTINALSSRVGCRLIPLLAPRRQHHKTIDDILTLRRLDVKSSGRTNEESTWLTHLEQSAMAS